MNLPPELVARILAMPGVVIHGESITPAKANPTKKVKPAELLPSVFNGTNIWVVGVETRSETNQRKWQARSRRTQAARRAVSQLFGKSLRALSLFAEHYHEGRTLSVQITRLASHRLDAGNVAASLKAVEDAVCLMLGADDGDPRWQASYHQETSTQMGVRIMLQLH